MKKRRPEIMKPGLKQLTPYEKRLATQVNKADRDRWAELMAQPWNKWKPTHPAVTPTAKSNKQSSKVTPPASPMPTSKRSTASSESRCITPRGA